MEKTARLQEKNIIVVPNFKKSLRNISNIICGTTAGISNGFEKQKCQNLKVIAGMQNAKHEKNAKKFPFEVFPMKHKQIGNSVVSSPNQEKYKKNFSVPHLRPNNQTPILISEELLNINSQCFTRVIPSSTKGNEKIKIETALEIFKENNENDTGFLPEIKVTHNDITPSKNNLTRNNRWDELKSETLRRVNNNQIANLELLLKKNKLANGIHKNNSKVHLGSAKSPIKLKPIEPNSAETRPISYQDSKNTGANQQNVRNLTGSAPNKIKILNIVKEQKPLKIEKKSERRKESGFKTKEIQIIENAIKQAEINEQKREENNMTPNFTFGKEQFEEIAK